MRLKLWPVSLEEDEGDQYGDGNDEAGDERRAPVAQKDDDDDGGEDDADEDGVAHAGDAVADQLRTDRRRARS